MFVVCRETISQLGDTVEEVGRLQGKVRQSLKELKIFLNGMGTVASNAVKELNTLKFDWLEDNVGYCVLEYLRINVKDYDYVILIARHTSSCTGYHVCMQ